ncbi:FAR-17a/AIG1-like protein [Chiua virens]|nr:FAR-17a/AIG1-like protein [Chiua virens]
MRRLLAFVLHATAAGIMTWGLSRLRDLGDWMVAQKGGYFLFLTNQGLVIAWLYMVVSLFCDIFPSVVATVRHVKKALLMISMPLEFVISTIYWSLLIFLPHLILPAERAVEGGFRRLDIKTDLALHAAPLLSLLIDFFAFESKFSKTSVRKVAPLIVVAFSIWYASFVEYCATFNGNFPYPFLMHSPFFVRVLIYASAAGIALGCFRALNTLHAQ